MHIQRRLHALQALRFVVIGLAFLLTSAAVSAKEKGSVEDECLQCGIFDEAGVVNVADDATKEQWDACADSGALLPLQRLCDTIPCAGHAMCACSWASRARAKGTAVRGMNLIDAICMLRVCIASTPNAISRKSGMRLHRVRTCWLPGMQVHTMVRHAQMCCAHAATATAMPCCFLRPLQTLCSAHPISKSSSPCKESTWVWPLLRQPSTSFFNTTARGQCYRCVHIQQARHCHMCGNASWLRRTLNGISGSY